MNNSFETSSSSSNICSTWHKSKKVSMSSSHSLGYRRKPYEFVLRPNDDLIDWSIELVDIEYEKSLIESCPPKAISRNEIWRLTYMNPTDTTISQIVKSSETKNSSFTFFMQQTLMYGHKITIGVEAELKIPFLTSSQVNKNSETGQELILESGQIWTSRQSQAYEIDTVLNIPANSKIEAVWYINWVEDLEIPYKMIIKVTGKKESVNLTTKDILVNLKNGGFDGEVHDESKSNELLVSLTGIYQGSFGMESFIQTYPI